jgi:hypothetical protein
MLRWAKKGKCKLTIYFTYIDPYIIQKKTRKTLFESLYRSHWIVIASYKTITWNDMDNKTCHPEVKVWKFDCFSVFKNVTILKYIWQYLNVSNRLSETEVVLLRPFPLFVFSPRIRSEMFLVKKLITFIVLQNSHLSHIRILPEKRNANV